MQPRTARVCTRLDDGEVYRLPDVSLQSEKYALNQPDLPRRKTFDMPSRKSFTTTSLLLTSLALNLAYADPTVTLNTADGALWHSSSAAFIAVDGAWFFFQEDGNLVAYDPHSSAVLWNSGTGGIDCYSGKCMLMLKGDDVGGSLIACQDRGGGCAPGYYGPYNDVDNFFWAANVESQCPGEVSADRIVFQSGDPHIALLAGDFIEWCSHGYDGFEQADPQDGAECPPAGTNPDGPSIGGPYPPPGGDG